MAVAVNDGSDVIFTLNAVEGDELRFVGLQGDDGQTDDGQTGDGQTDDGQTDDGQTGDLHDDDFPFNVA